MLLNNIKPKNDNVEPRNQSLRSLGFVLINLDHIAQIEGQQAVKLELEAWHSALSLNLHFLPGKVFELIWC